MADQYTYVDEADDRLRITAGPGPRIVTTTFGREGDPDSTASVKAPTGADAVEFARAVLAAAGDTGHEVVSPSQIATIEWAAASKLAVSMRDRAIAAVAQHSPGVVGRSHLSESIRALPLLPDDGDTYEAESDVHVATPEGITPCGQGTRDVTADPMITEVTCVECLHAIARERFEQGMQMRTELETALKAGRGTPWRSLLRQVEELRARGEDTSESTDTARHNPTACTDVGCLACRVAQLERDMGRREQHARNLDQTDARLTERVGAAEFRLDALELAAREATQSGGAEHVQVTGGYAEGDDH